MKPALVQTPQALEQLCESLRNESVIALDTEFAREYSYFPHLGLVQIAGGDHIACIDPLAFDIGPALSPLLLDTRIIKIFHACLQDMEVIWHTFGLLPCPIHDTQLAAALMGEDHQISYANLVEQETGTKLAKTETRTDWMRRPLSAAQLDYAADDVRFLEQIYHKQVEQLAQLGRSEWLMQDCEQLCESPETRFAPELCGCWKRVKGTHRLQGLELALVERISAWREQRAVEQDRTRRRILPDDLVIEIACRRPANSSELGRIGRVQKLLDNDQLVSLADELNHTYAMKPDEWPSNRHMKPDAEQAAALKRILEKLRQRAAELGISPGMLCNRRDAEKLVAGRRDLPVLQGWRHETIGRDLVSML
jgi:ribonuclease D